MLIDYQSYDEFCELRESLDDYCKNEIVNTILNEKSAMFWEVNCFDNAFQMAFDKFMEMFKHHNNLQEFATMNANMLACALTFTLMGYVRTHVSRFNLYYPSPWCIMAVTNHRPKLQRLFNICIENYTDVTKRNWNEFIDVNFVGDSLIPRIQLQLMLAIAMHSPRSPFHMLSNDILIYLCGHLDN